MSLLIFMLCLFVFVFSLSFIVCVSCKQPVAGICQIHGNPMSLLKKTKAVLSLPLTMCVQESFLPNAGLGVFSLSVFEVGSLFGPMEGEKLTFEENSSRTNNAYVWEVCTVIYVDIL